MPLIGLGRWVVLVIGIQFDVDFRIGVSGICGFCLNA